MVGWRARVGFLLGAVPLVRVWGEGWGRRRVDYRSQLVEERQAQARLAREREMAAVRERERRLEQLRQKVQCFSLWAQQVLQCGEVWCLFLSPGSGQCDS